jgi:hypothetical protein
VPLRVRSSAAPEGATVVAVPVVVTRTVSVRLSDAPNSHCQTLEGKPMA